MYRTAADDVLDTANRVVDALDKARSAQDAADSAITATDQHIVEIENDLDMVFKMFCCKTYFGLLFIWVGNFTALCSLSVRLQAS